MKSVGGIRRLRPSNVLGSSQRPVAESVRLFGILQSIEARRLMRRSRPPAVIIRSDHPSADSMPGDITCAPTDTAFGESLIQHDIACCGQFLIRRLGQANGR
jgi:hypothetical protein